MSIKVMTAVWEYSQHKGSNLLVLLAIADHAHDDGRDAYPSIKALAKKTRMVQRGIYRIIAELVASGELLVEKNASPKRTNLYQVMVKSLHPDVHDRVNEDSLNDEPPFTPGVNPHERQTVIEPLSEPSILTQGVWPDWYSDLWSIPGFTLGLDHCQIWLDQNQISLSTANQTAAAVKGKWPGPKTRPYTDAWATFRSWINRAPQGSNNGNNAERPSEKPSPFANYGVRSDDL